MNAAFNTDGITTTQRALSRRSCGMSSGTFRISSMTLPAFSSRFVSSFAFSSAPAAKPAGAISSAPYINAVQRFISFFSFGLDLFVSGLGPVGVSLTMDENQFTSAVANGRGPRQETEWQTRKRESLRYPP